MKNGLSMTGLSYEDTQTILAEEDPNTSWVIRAGLTTNLCISHLQGKNPTRFARKLLRDMNDDQLAAYQSFLSEHGEGLGLGEEQLSYISNAIARSRKKTQQV